MSSTTVHHHLHGDDEIRAVVRKDGMSGREYAELHLGEDFTVFAGEAELRRVREVVGLALVGLAEPMAEVA